MSKHYLIDIIYRFKPIKALKTKCRGRKWVIGIISFKNPYYGPKLSLSNCVEHLKVVQTHNDMSKHSQIKIINPFKPIKALKTKYMGKKMGDMDSQLQKGLFWSQIEPILLPGNPKRGPNREKSIKISSNHTFLPI